MHKNQSRIVRVSTLLLVVATLSSAQAPPFVSTNPSQILSAFQAARGNWVANIAGYANSLFGALAVIEFAWSGAVMVLEKADLQSFTAALVRKIMWIGGFYMLLINGPVWIPFIIDSFTQIGQNSSGVMSISPSNVFGQGLNVAGALSNGFSVAGFLTQPAVILSLVFAAIIVVISYAMITIQFMVAMVESYIVVAAGFIFLGFGGSRWTAPYAERYIGLAVSNGVKILVIYLLISVGTNLGNAWVAEAQGASISASPEMVALDVMAAALMYMMLCWQIPKLFSAVLGGSPALAGGDLIAAGASLIAGGAAVAAVASGGAGVLVGGARPFGGVGAATSAGTGSALSLSSAGDIGSTGVGGASVPPPSPNGSGHGSAFASTRQPEPPGSSGSSGANIAPAASETSSPSGAIGQAAGAAEKSQDTLDAVSARMRNLGRRLNSVLPPDHAPHSTPPRMDIDHHE
ncbi:MAG TPA: P-type conjugative transfer protein TrbL [Bryobacteraceae bacterium]|jgi:type IV secretion system protein TrbL|nr:P-type conjugative transfer protein TrbL [Bryobacteraceae bacterium]